MKRLALVALMLAFLCPAVQATTMRFEFSGYLYMIAQPVSGLSIGDEFSGFFYYSWTEPQTPLTGNIYPINEDFEIEYGVFFDQFSITGSGMWMNMTDSFPGVPNVVWAGGGNVFGNTSMNYIEDLAISTTDNNLYICATTFDSSGIFPIDGQITSIKATPIPEPSTMSFIAIGLLMLILLIRTNRQNSP